MRDLLNFFPQERQVGRSFRFSNSEGSQVWLRLSSGRSFRSLNGEGLRYG